MKTKIAYLIPLIFLIFLCVWLFVQFTRTQNQLDKPTPADDKSTHIISSVGQLIDLPSDESPTVATIADKKQLQNQPFFTTAENGDHILIYTKNNKAILYRPSTHKIIDIAALRL